MTHICVSEIIIIDSVNGLSPDRRQAIIWTNAGILLIGPLGTNFNEILIEMNTFSFKKMHFKMSSAKWRLFRLGLNVLIELLGQLHHLYQMRRILESCPEGWWSCWANAPCNLGSMCLFSHNFSCNHWIIIVSLCGKQWYNNEHQLIN